MVQCTSCRETHSNSVGVNRFVRHGNKAAGTGNEITNWCAGDERHEWKSWRSQLRLEVQELQGEQNRVILEGSGHAYSRYVQRESSATIKAAPKPYEQSEPAKPRAILEFDCRGLEFVDFKPEVRSKRRAVLYIPQLTTSCRASGWQRAPTLAPNSRLSICRKAIGLTTTRSRERKSASRISSGRLSDHNAFAIWEYKNLELIQFSMLSVYAWYRVSQNGESSALSKPRL